MYYVRQVSAQTAILSRVTISYFARWGPFRFPTSLRARAASARVSGCIIGFGSSPRRENRPRTECGIRLQLVVLDRLGQQCAQCAGDASDGVQFEALRSTPGDQLGRRQHARLLVRIRRPRRLQPLAHDGARSTPAGRHTRRDCGRAGRRQRRARQQHGQSLCGGCLGDRHRRPQQR